MASIVAGGVVDRGRSIRPVFEKLGLHQPLPITVRDPPRTSPLHPADGDVGMDGVAVLRLVERYGSRRLSHTGTDCLGPLEAFEGFRVATDCWTEFVDAEGREYRAQLFRHVLVADGRHKVFRYYE